ncbi:DUF962-domain-containing protein [Choiromyces venosus 120613-1]|uniref:DUF962-domain-containing protein n=1 Tax=Choiromyces venosus 120613-1 TaxID=1336337 RepID=A0A3N4J6T1_9PEZI|nr:DUF962-domain-containing protein [Choiromyces venosus 120613-1]
MGALDLEEQLIFYGSYHHTKGNILIHLLGVPSIMATTFLFASNTPPLLPLPSQIPYFPTNLAFFGALFYAGLYILMEPIAGLLLAPLILTMTALVTHLTATDPVTANTIAGYVFVLAWIAQFVGHGVYEKRAPALFDNLVQALILAPFFVWFEVLFWCGYRPELKVRVEEGVTKQLEVFRRKEGEGKKKQ